MGQSTSNSSSADLTFNHGVLGSSPSGLTNPSLRPLFFKGFSYFLSNLDSRLDNGLSGGDWCASTQSSRILFSMLDTGGRSRLASRWTVSRTQAGNRIVMGIFNSRCILTTRAYSASALPHAPYASDRPPGCSAALPPANYVR